MKVARINIVMPPDLKRRMDAAPAVNWSAVAREAFERKLAALGYGGDHRECDTPGRECARCAMRHGG